MQMQPNTTKSFHETNEMPKKQPKSYEIDLGQNVNKLKQNNQL